MTLRIKPLFITLALPLFLAACTSTTQNNASFDVSQLSNQTWKLSSINGQDLALNEHAKAPTLELNDTLKANGNAGCNLYFGQAELKEGQLRIEQMGMTMMMCQEPSMQIEQTFSHALAQWNQVTINGQQLTLTTKDNVLVFNAQ